LKNILNLYTEELSTSKLKNNPSKTNEIIEKNKKLFNHIKIT